MKLKTKIARMRISLRKRQRKKEEEKIQKLQMQRNKALKEAKSAIAEAQAREDAKDAALKRSQAKARLSSAKNKRGKALLTSLKRGSQSLLKNLRGAVEQKPKRRTKGHTKA